MSVPDSKTIDITLSLHEKLLQALSMLPEAIGIAPGREVVDKVIEDFLFDFDTLFQHEERMLAKARFKLLTAHTNDHARLMDLLNSLRYANRIGILSGDGARRLIRDGFAHHVEYFDRVFFDYLRVKRQLAQGAKGRKHPEA
jgi:hemerythrin